MQKSKLLLLAFTLLSMKTEAINWQRVGNFGLFTGTTLSIPSSIMYLSEKGFRNSIIDPRIPADKYDLSKFITLAGGIKAIDRLDNRIKLYRNLSLLGLGVIASSYILKSIK